jgi:tRNA nucleotidyltransferase (CCA-adding enzyme)
MLCHELGILPFVSPELEGCFGIDQNKSHVFDVGTHLVNSLQHAADREFPLHVRLAALFHDIGKPATRRFDKAAGDYTFYGHEVVGAKITKRTLHELKFDKKTIEKVTKLVRYHMFFSDPDEITLSAVRRMIVNVGKDLIWDLIHVRYSDRIGMGRPKEAPYRLRKYESMIEEALRDPVSVKMLKLNGDVMINEMDFKPGPRMGWILHALLEHVLDDPSKNTQDYLEHWARELDRLPDEELQAMGEAGKSKRDELEEAEVAQLRKKHKVN